MLDLIVSLLKKPEVQVEEEKPLYKVTLIGKPNVGKSSLMNLLLKTERSIVSAQAGTTREAISEKIRFYKENIQLTDTAGIRRKRSVTEDIESLMVKSSLSSIKNADIVLLLIDESQAEISDQELKLAFYAFEEGKALIILFNKDDLATDEKKKDLKMGLSKYDYFFKKIETLNISCKSGKNIGHIMPLIDTVWKRYTQKISDIDITTLFKTALFRKPLFHKKLPLMLFSAEQVKSGPIIVLLRVNESKWFGDSQKAFFENTLRSEYDLRSVPVFFALKKRNQ